MSEIKDLVVTHKFDLKSNMEEVKASIAAAIAKYDVVVSEDRLTEAKELMATFNKDKKAFTDKCKEFLGIIAAPIDDFKAKQKEIEKLYDDGRAKIADQVAKFEAKKLIEIEGVLEAYKNEVCEAKQINPESVVVKDLVQLSAVNTNKTGYSIAKKTAETIDARIQAVELQILKAKQEEAEKAAREREIAEKAKEEAEAKARQREADLIAKAEREKNEAIERTRREEQAKLATPSTVTTAPTLVNEMHGSTTARVNAVEPKVEPKFAEDGRRIYCVTAHFEVIAPDGVDHERIKQALKAKMEAGGITTLKSIEVQ